MATHDVTGYLHDVTTAVSAQAQDVTFPTKNNASYEQCTHGIPDIVSYQTSVGLSSFSSSYGGIHGYIAVAVCLFGVLSNSAIIIVLTRKNMASSTNTILMWLAVSDLLTMLSYLPFAIHFYLMEPQDPSRPPFSSPEFPWICFLLFHASFSIVCHSVAIWLTIALAIFRYIYICKPTKGAFYCSQQRARQVVILIILLTMVISIPNAFVNTFETIYENRTVVMVTRQQHSNADVIGGEYNDSSVVMGGANTNMNTNPNTTTSNIVTKVTIRTPYFFPSLRKSTPIEATAIQFNSWIQAILIKLVPCGMLSSLTLLLVHAMHKAYRKRLKLKSQGKKAESDKHGEHNRITGMLLAVVVLFTLTELPQGILTLMNIFVDCFYEVVYYKLGDLLDIMALTNNSVNFVLYCTMSTQFRNTFSSIFCPSGTSRPKWLSMRIVSSRRHNNNGNSPNTIEAGRGDHNGSSKQKKKGNNHHAAAANKDKVAAAANNHQHHNHNHNNHDDGGGGGGCAAAAAHQKELLLQGDNCNLVANELQDVAGPTNLKADSEQLLICTQDPPNGGSDISHTHGFSSGHTHV